jgi:phytoene synthase
MRVTPWQRTLTASGLDDPGVRADYTAAARVMARRYPDLYALLRLMAPPAWQPHFLAGFAWGITGDDHADGPERDAARYHHWADGFRQALATGVCDQPHLRAFLHTVDVSGISHHDVHTHMAGQAERIWITHYATEQDHHDHIDRVVMPTAHIALAFTRSPLRDDTEALRPALDAAQRIDDLIDLHDDARHGRLTVPQTDLLRFEVTRADLATARDTPAVRGLIAHRCGRARAALHAATGPAQRLKAEDPDFYRLIFRPLSTYGGLLLDAVERRGAAIHRHPWPYLRPTPFHLTTLLLTLRARINHMHRPARQRKRDRPL